MIPCNSSTLKSVLKSVFKPVLLTSVCAILLFLYGTLDSYAAQGKPGNHALSALRVSALPLSGLHIEEIQVLPNTATQTIAVRVRLVNSGAQAQQGTLAAALEAASTVQGTTPHWKYPVLATVSLTVEAGGQRTLTLGPQPWTPGRESWWWPNVPYRPNYRAQLHRLTLSLRPAGETAQVKSVRFGFCTSAQTGNTYTLNGVRINLRGDNLSTSLLSPDTFAHLPGLLPPSKNSSGWPAAVRSYQRLNCNVVRIHRAPCTPYMLDVCDELGLLVVPEPVLATEQKDDEEKNSEEKNGGKSPVALLRERVLRDRNHPCIFKWSLENIPAQNRSTSLLADLYDVVKREDGTRPCSMEGGDTSSAYPVWPHFTVIERHSQPAGTANAVGGHLRKDRPYGQGEILDPGGSVLQKLIWMGMETVSLRAHDNADIRPGSLIEIWPGIIPDLKPTRFSDPLQMKTKSPAPPLPGVEAPLTPSNPWNDPRLLLIQRTFSPICVFDLDWCAANTRSNGTGFYPNTFQVLMGGKETTRTLTVFNDEFTGSTVEVKVEQILHPKATQNLLLATTVRSLKIASGGHAAFTVPVKLPVVPDNAVLEMRFSVKKASTDGKTDKKTDGKDGGERFHDSDFFLVQGTKGATVQYTGRDDTTQGNWIGNYGSQGFMLPIRGGVAINHDDSILIRRGTGFDTVAADELHQTDVEEINAMLEWDKTPVVQDKRLPPGGNGLTERHAIALMGTTSLAVRVDSNDNKPHQLSLYLLDYERKGLGVDIDAFDLRGNPLDTRRFDHYEEGAYVRYRFTGTVILMVRSLTPFQRPLLTAIFVDKL